MSKTKRLLISMLTLLCCTGVWATGELNGLFTINASGDKVQFSQGNLRAKYKEGWSWSFSPNQWDYVGNNSANINITGNGTISVGGEVYVDLFGWSTSATTYGIHNSNEGPTYSGDFVDWGNNIGTGWRTLTSAEWVWILGPNSSPTPGTNCRASGSTVNGTSNARYVHATINTDGTGVNGMILFPDGVTIANDEATSWGTVNGNSRWEYATKCTSAQWTALAAKGCVFLPAAGNRSGTSVYNAGTHGHYWSSTSNGDYYAWEVDFISEALQTQGNYSRHQSFSVRLVKDYQLPQDGEGNYLIGSADDWKLFASLVQTTPTANAKMTADIDLGDDLTMVGSTSGNSYQGTFDGQGHTLTVNYNSTIHGIAPFQHVGAATISNLHVDGSIVTTGCGAGGIVSKISGNLTVSRCWVSATLQTVSSGGNRGTIGGIVSYCEEANCSIVIEDCVFTGVIVNTEMCGGIMSHLWNGSASVTMRRCLNVGTNTGANAYNYTFIRDTGAGTGTRNLETSTLFYKTAFGNAQGTQATAAQLSDGTTTTALNNERAEEVWVQDLVTNQPMLKLFATKAYTVPSSGIGTFSAKAKFTVPDGLTAHYCKTYDSENHTIGVVDIDGAVPANTGVILKGTPGQTYTLTGTNSTAATVTDNALVAVVEATHVNQESGDYTNFMMSGGKFIKIEASSDPEVKMPANRAYLQILTSAAGSRPITLSWDNDATGVNEVRGEKLEARGEWYNLAGQRVARPAKGLYIVNGKKVVIK